MKVYCIVHFSPIEKYPPAINMLRYIAGHKAQDELVYVLTTDPGAGRKLAEVEGVTIVRLASGENGMGRWQRMKAYLKFNYASARFLKKQRPASVLYYETLSAGGAWFIRKQFNGNSRLFIHYHEYNTMNEIQSGMVLNRWLHRMEYSLYRKASWISHTNQKRMDLFLQDIDMRRLKTQLLPNYPPASWENRVKLVERNQDARIGLVYVGALSMQSMLTKQMADFVAANPTLCYWDIYSDNHEPAVLEYLGKLNASNIAFKGAVAYDELPNTLPAYDIGVLLYKGDTPNFAHNAPNKFFEYLTAGLNTWYSPGMKEMNSYEQRATKPWVRSIDFKQLRLPPIHDARRVEQIPAQQYRAEDVYGPLWQAMQGDLAKG